MLVRLDDRRSATFAPRAGTADDKVVWEVWEDRTYGWTPRDVEGRVVLDLGANIGAFTVWALCARAGHVRAVEPLWANFERLAAHVALNGFAKGVEVIHAAATPHRVIRIFPEQSGASAWTTTKTDTAGLEQVDGRSLEQLLEGLGDSVMVKCDIEGAEYELFASADVELLRRVDHLAMEWHTPGVEGGLGARPYPEAHGWPVGDLIRRLTVHHRVKVEGEPHAGGRLWADRY